MLLFIKLNRTSQEVENYPYWEYEQLIKDYLEYQEAKNIKKSGLQQII